MITMQAMVRELDAMAEWAPTAEAEDLRLAVKRLAELLAEHLRSEMQ